MDFFFARQAIFDKDGEIIGYELFHRSSAVNKYQQMNGDRATLELLAQIIHTSGIERVTNGKLALKTFDDSGQSFWLKRWRPQKNLKLLYVPVLTIFRANFFSKTELIPGDSLLSESDQFISKKLQF